MMSVNAAVLTISDRCAAGSAQDKSGPTIIAFLKSRGFLVSQQAIVPDVKEQIEEILKLWCDTLKVDLIITTGGTGLTPRDVTPEATKSILDKETTAISVALIVESLKITPMAMLSRLTSGIRNSTLIINLPGSSKACGECVLILEPVLKHAIDQLRDDKTNISQTHEKISHDVKSKVTVQKVALRPRESQYEMISMNQAISIIINEVKGNLKTEMISLKDLDKLNGRLLAVDIKAEVPLPPFPASMKDGYAVIAGDGAGPRQLISASATAGSYIHDLKIESGFCARVSTGAAVPPGADSVVQVEDTEVVQQTQDGEESVVLIKKSPRVGQDIRPIGCDISVDGNPVLKKNTSLGPIELGVLAAVGVNQVLTYKPPDVALLSTGDEIIEPGESLPPGAVWDSNKTTLLSLLKQHSINTVDLGIAKDNVDEVYAKLKKGLSSADIILTTGGVSMGEKDLLKEILKIDFNAKIHFARINLKPGKPTTFATCVYNGVKKLIFALPGNPVSAFVTCHLFVIPAILILSGRLLPDNPNDLLGYHSIINATLSIDKEFIKLDPRPEFARAIITYQDNNIIATITGNQRSSRLMSAKDANALVLLPQSDANNDKIKNGATIKALLI